MNRAFITLYGFVVLTIVIIGWSLDQFWQHYAPTHPAETSEILVVDLIQTQLNSIPATSLNRTVEELSKAQKIQLKLIHLEEVADTPFLQELLSEQTVIVQTSEENKDIYRKLNHLDYAFRITFDEPNPKTEFIYDFFIFIFYTSIALAVFFWVWPLSKGLQQLEKHTRILGQDTLPDPIEVNPSSPVYPVARSFNSMAKRLRSLMSTQKEMTYGVSHELRTPLARMKFALEIAEHSENIENVKSHLSGIKKDVADMEDLIASLLTYASFDGANAKLEKKSGDLGFLINQLIERQIERLASEKHTPPITIAFDNQLNDQLVMCEWRLIECVVVNLLQNASRFAKHRILVSLSVTEDTKNCLSVEDDGPGIASEDRERVFDSFVRLNNAENGKQRGFGLGLALTKRIVQWHTGSISVDTSPLGGAKFKVLWPNEV